MNENKKANKKVVLYFVVTLASVLTGCGHCGRGQIEYDKARGKGTPTKLKEKKVVKKKGGKR